MSRLNVGCNFCWFDSIEARNVHCDLELFHDAEAHLYYGADGTVYAVTERVNGSSYWGQGSAFRCLFAWESYEGWCRCTESGADHGSNHRYDWGLGKLISVVRVGAGTERAVKHKWLGK